MIPGEPVTGSPDTTRLLLSSSPGGAEILVDGQATGRRTAATALQPTEIIFGKARGPQAPRRLTLRLTGFHDYNQYFTLFDGAAARVDAELVGSSELTGELSISSMPSGAKIFLDGEDMGRLTPAIITDVTPTRHAVRLERLEFSDLLDNLGAESGATVFYGVELDSPGKGTISGTVFDQVGNSLLDAEVMVKELAVSVQTTLYGTFMIRNLEPGTYTLEVTALTSAGTLTGKRTAVIVAADGHTFNADLVAMFPSAEATVIGTVTNQLGDPVPNARVFIVLIYPPHDSPGIFETRTDEQGDYRIEAVLAGSFLIHATVSGYKGIRKAVDLTQGQENRVDFQIESLAFADPPLAPTWDPTEGSGVIITMPRSVSREQGSAGRGVLSSFMRHIRHPLAGRLAGPNWSGGRRVPSDMLIECDLVWVGSYDENIVGYKIWRSVAADGGFMLRAQVNESKRWLFGDVGLDFTVGEPVRYKVSAFDTLGNESERSTPVTFTPFDLVRLSAPDPGATVSFAFPSTFSWMPVPRITAYVVVIYDEFPTGNVDPFWTSPLILSPKTGAVVDGTILLSGKEYYWVVVGINTVDSDKATEITLSELRKFTAQK